MARAENAENAQKTLVSVATYNEMENLPRLVDEIFHYLPQADLLVIDDNSPDGTGQWCDEAAARHSRIHCLHRPGKQGVGTAILAAMRYAVDHGYRHLLNMDADFSHPPRYLPILAAGMDPPDRPPVDVMIGSRYVPGGGTENWPWRRKLMSRAVNCYARWLLGLKANDCSGGYRCYRSALLAKLDHTLVRSRGYSFQEEILWRLARLGARIAETPIIFVDRRRGASKINLREAWDALRIIFWLGLGSRLGLVR
jgi:dolichol-phosphate mannosyltransferase